jgi:hypothetical protein
VHLSACAVSHGLLSGGLLSQKERRLEMNDLTKLKPSERATRLHQAAREGRVKFNEWELGFIKTNKESSFASLTDRQEAVMRKLEDKVVDAELSQKDDYEYGSEEGEVDTLTGELKFHPKGKRK